MTKAIPKAKGFKDEKAIWQYQKSRLVGLWDRYELVTPAGHPDVKGSYLRQIYYIENKVGDGSQGLKALEPSQKKYIRWLLRCGQRVWICFGDRYEKELVWYRVSLDPCDNLMVVEDTPPFWPV